MIWFININSLYSLSMKSIYEKMRAENYEVNWGNNYKVNPQDLKVMCATNFRWGNEEYWKRCIYVPHSVSEHFPNYTYKKHGLKLGGILTVGPKTHKKYLENAVFDRENVRMVGWPKGDILFNVDRKKKTKQLKELLDLPYEKTVLIICTVHGHLKQEIEIMKEVITYSEGRFNILIKDRGVIHTELSSGKKHIRHIGTLEDVTPFYLVTDVLLSCLPVSSTVIEIYQVGKPSIAVNFLGERGLDQWKYAYLGEPEILCELSELNSNIMVLLEDGDKKTEERRKKLEQFIYKPDGRATDRAIKAITELGMI